MKVTHRSKPLKDAGKRVLSNGFTWWCEICRSMVFDYNHFRVMSFSTLSSILLSFDLRLREWLYDLWGSGWEVRLDVRLLWAWRDIFTWITEFIIYWIFLRVALPDLYKLQSSQILVLHWWSQIFIDMERNIISIKLKQLSKGKKARNQGEKSPWSINYFRAIPPLPLRTKENKQ